MRLRLVYGAILALTVALVVPYTAAAAEKTGTVDVAAARVVAEQQLISLGIDPGDAVFQVGARNYAGPDCPGSGWNCTSAATVVQITTGTALTSINKFECSGPVCIVDQPNVGGTNEASCVQNTSVNPETQSCRITQTNTTNTNSAFVFQSIRQSQPQDPQEAGQLVTVNQANLTGANKSAIVQTIAQHQASDMSGGTIAQHQEAHQRADVCQGGTDPCSSPSNGKNVSNVNQSNVQRLMVHFDESSRGEITQHQNTDPNNVRAIAIGARPTSTAVVSQRSLGDTNDSRLLQFNRQVAMVHDGDENENDDEISTSGAFSGPVTQQQGITGNPFCTATTTSPAGGLCGYVVQHSTGVQSALGRQDELQKVQGPPGATQRQFGPEFCCATQIGGNSENDNEVSQVKVQRHTSSLAEGIIQGHCDSDLTSCSVNQRLTQNRTTQSNSCTSSPGVPCNPTIVCHTGPTEGGGQFTVCTPGTASGPLPAPCPSPLCVGDAPTPRITMISPLWFEAASPANI